MDMHFVTNFHAANIHYDDHSMCCAVGLSAAQCPQTKCLDMANDCKEQETLL